VPRSPGSLVNRSSIPCQEGRDRSASATLSLIRTDHFDPPQKRPRGNQHLASHALAPTGRHLTARNPNPYQRVCQAWQSAFQVLVVVSSIWQPDRLEKERSGAHILAMANTRSATPMVEVVAPDGSKEFWIAALAHKDAVAAVKKCIPADYTAELSILRLPVGPKMERLRPGEVRKVQP